MSGVVFLCSENIPLKFFRVQHCTKFSSTGSTEDASLTDFLQPFHGLSIETGDYKLDASCLELTCRGQVYLVEVV